MSRGKNSDRVAIDHLIKMFLGVFDNRKGKAVNLNTLNDICAPDCVITKACGDTPSIYTLAEFIAPRQKLLCGGGLIEFHEFEISQDTLVFGAIAQRNSIYQKSGIYNGEEFSTRGVKITQLINVFGQWKIMALAWDDETDTNKIPSGLMSH